MATTTVLPSRQVTTFTPVPDHKQWRDFESLKSEEERLHTFRGWKCQFLNEQVLAKEGFFYLKKEDHVQCAFCRGVIGEWEEGDVPSVEHRKHYPTCPFLNGLPVGNVALGEAPPPPVQFDNHFTGYDTCERYIRTNAHPERSGRWSVQNSKSPSNSLEDLGIISHDEPHVKEYALCPKRFDSFKNWPTDLKQTPRQLADAGFYYVGLSDHVRCFHCDGGLRNWSEDDDPWEEHARWFSRCPFLLLTKGKEYVNAVLARHPPDPKLLSKPTDVPVTNSTAEENNNTSNGHVSPPENVLVLHQIDPRNEEESMKCPRNEDESAKEADSERNVDESRLCKVCYGNDVDVALYPCGHVCCSTCVSALKNCPICRTEIKGTLRIYI